MATIQTESLTYFANGTTLKGHLAFDADRGASPAVIVIHEWWGLDEYIKGRAEQLAALGYSALAIDMYGEGKTADNPNDAGALMNAVLEDMETGTGRLKAAYEALKSHPSTNDKMAAIGYCFGGAMVLHMARIGMDLDAVASFHGALGSFHKPGPGEVKAKVLVCHGAADEFIPEDDITSFKAEMEAADADYEFVAYEGALHGFTSKEATSNGEKYDLPLAYDENADKQSWQSMLDLFGKVF